MNPKITVAVCAVVLVVALGALWLEFKSDTIQIPRQEIVGVKIGLGQALGEETAKVAPDHGRVVVVTASTAAQLKQRPNYLWTALESELQKHSMSITVAESVFNAWNSGSMPADRAAFKEVLDRHADADALVFLVDLPEWGRVVEAFPTSYKGPKIVALDNLQQQMRARYRGYFENGLLTALIGSRTQPGGPTQPKTPREWFDKKYQVYTPANAELLPP